MDFYINDTQMRAIYLDGLRSSHPIQQDILNAEEVHEIFDSLS
jgi:aminopeptidase N